MVFSYVTLHHGDIVVSALHWRYEYCVVLYVMNQLC